MPLSEEVVADYQTTRLSLKSHPMALLRPVFAADRILSSQQVADMPDGKWIRTAGVVLIRQRPGKGNAIFMTLEDETGVCNVVLWARMFEQFRREVMAARLMAVEGVGEVGESGDVRVDADAGHALGLRVRGELGVHDRAGGVRLGRGGRGLGCGAGCVLAPLISGHSPPG